MIFFFFLINYELSLSKIREYFFRGKKCLLPMGNLIIFFKIPPILQLEVGFFSDTNFFSHIFQNLAHLFTLNFIFVNLKKNQRTFFLGKKCLLLIENLIMFFKIPLIFKFKLAYFPIQKLFVDFLKFEKFIYSKLHICKFEKKISNFLER